MQGASLDIACIHAGWRQMQVGAYHTTNLDEEVAAGMKSAGVSGGGSTSC